MRVAALEVFLGIWETTWGEDTVIIGRAAGILPFFNRDVCSGTVVEVCTEDERGFGGKLVEELTSNDIREVLDEGFAVLKYETVINWGTLVSELENLVVIGIWGAAVVSAELGVGYTAVSLMPDLVLTGKVDIEVDVLSVNSGSRRNTGLVKVSLSAPKADKDTSECVSAPLEWLTEGLLLFPIPVDSSEVTKDILEARVVSAE